MKLTIWLGLYALAGTLAGAFILGLMLWLALQAAAHTLARALGG